LAATTSVNAVAWSDDDQYIAAGVSTGGGNELRVYSFNGAALSLAATYSIGSNVLSVDWHPYQYYIALGASRSPQIQTFSFSGNSLSQLTTVTYGIQVNTVEFHPSGNYLAIGSSLQTPAQNNITIYPVNSNGTLNTAASYSINDGGNSFFSLDWNVTGSYLALGSSPQGGSFQLHVYQLLTAPLSLALNVGLTFGDTVYSVAWNDYYPTVLAIGLNSLQPLLRLYNHNPTAGTLTLITADSSIQKSICSLDWRRGGECLALGQTGTAGTLRTYGFNDQTSTLTVSTQLNFSAPVCAVSWSNAGEYLAVGTDTKLLQTYLAESFLFSSCVTFSDLKLVMDCDVNLHYLWWQFGDQWARHGAESCTNMHDSG
jgi:WD40 repeat protein